MVREAAIERENAYSDSTLRAFDAYAEGHVDFLADFGDFGGEQIIRTDRIALQLEWARGRGSLSSPTSCPPSTASAPSSSEDL